MQFEATGLSGSYVIKPECLEDARGFFARIFCQTEFRSHHLVTEFVQANNTFSVKKGTLRGFHYQLEPYADTKLVRCIRGSFWDCILDLRRDSPTFAQWHGRELSAENRLMMYVPKGFAHGFLTLADDAEVMYWTDKSYAPQYERIVRWNDPRFDICWPFEPISISEKDANAPDFDPRYHLGVADVD